MSSVDFKKVNAIAQNVNFVTRFENGLQNLLAVLDKTSVTKLPAGAAFTTYAISGELESGTVNLPGIMGIGAGIDFVKNLGYKKIYNHEIQLIEELYNGLKKNKNIILYTPSPKKYGYAPVLSFNYKGLSSGETAKILSINGIAVRSGLHCAPIAHKSVGTLEEGTVRVSVSVYNNHKEIEKLIYVLSDEKNFKKL